MVDISGRVSVSILSYTLCRRFAQKISVCFLFWSQVLPSNEARAWDWMAVFPCQDQARTMWPYLMCLRFTLRLSKKRRLSYVLRYNWVKRGDIPYRLTIFHNSHAQSLQNRDGLIPLMSMQLYIRVRKYFVNITESLKTVQRLLKFPRIWD